MALVFVADGVLLKITCDMIGRPYVSIPIGIYTVGVHSCCDQAFVGDIILNVVMPAIRSQMTPLEADLAKRMTVT